MNMDQQPYEIRERRNEITLGDILQIIRANWYWFLLSVILCVGLGVFYIMRTPKVYTRTATVLIKDHTRGGGMSEASAFEELNMFSIKSNVDNEILIFHSRQLMAEVARRLRLDLSYTVKKGLRPVELYTHTPVSVVFPDRGGSSDVYFCPDPCFRKRNRNFRIFIG